MDTKKLIDSIFVSFSLIPERVWIIGFSGGKDSSLLVDLATEYISEYDRNKVLHVIYSDTLIEYPMVRDYAYEFLDELDNYREKTRLEIYTHRVKPAIGRDFISFQLIKGYPMPHRKFRWCTDKIKIIPARKVITEIIREYGESNIALLNGTRLDESKYRKNIMKKRVERCRDCVDPVTGFSVKYVLKNMKSKTGSEFTETLPLYVTKSRGFNANVKVYSPLAYMKEEEVWKIIKIRSKPYFTNKQLYIDLLKLYGKYGGKFRSKDKIRFGCWLCTVATKDKSGEYFIKVFKKQRQKLDTLKWARNALFIISHNAPEIFRKKGKYPKQKYDGLNEYAIELTRAIYHVVYVTYRDAYKSYLFDKEYMEYINNLIGKINYKRLLQIIQELRTKQLPLEVQNVLNELEKRIKSIKIGQTDII
ncbi:MAG: phosphoadenosine phosphosulfate reductase family protein [Staphylothermus sp.]|nr:phosphoadenosine phosphosulfate reductase family protein [Staphylothermus sp.]